MQLPKTSHRGHQESELMEEEGGYRSPLFSGLRTDCGIRDLKARGGVATSGANNGSKHLLSTFYVVSIIHSPAHLFLTSTLGGRWYSYPHFYR